MMDALEFIKQKARMCNTYPDCKGCPIYNEGVRSYGDKYRLCDYFFDKNPEEAISIVEQWAEKHPPKTRQSEFLKIFPNASISDGGHIDIQPCKIDENFNCEKWTDEGCWECKQRYWLLEMGASEDDS